MKCDKYWPGSEGPLELGSYSVSWITEEQRPGFIVAQFSLKDNLVCCCFFCFLCLLECIW
jgi:hypothetical protein